MHGNEGKLRLGTAAHKDNGIVLRTAEEGTEIRDSLVVHLFIQRTAVTHFQHGHPRVGKVQEVVLHLLEDGQGEAAGPGLKLWIRCIMAGFSCAYYKRCSRRGSNGLVARVFRAKLLPSPTRHTKRSRRWRTRPNSSRQATPPQISIASVRRSDARREHSIFTFGGGFALQRPGIVLFDEMDEPGQSLFQRDVHIEQDVLHALKTADRLALELDAFLRIGATLIQGKR